MNLRDLSIERLPTAESKNFERAAIAFFNFFLFNALIDVQNI
jgi:hypothetical protein